MAGILTALAALAVTLTNMTRLLNQGNERAVTSRDLALVTAQLQAINAQLLAAATDLDGRVTALE